MKNDNKDIIIKNIIVDEEESEEEKALSLVSKVTEPTNSQRDRLEISGVRSLQIANFIDALVTKSSSRNKLKDTTTTKIKNMIDNNSDDVTFAGLVTLLKVLEDSDNHFTIGLLSNIKELYKIDQENDNTDSSDSHISNNFSKEDLEKAKKYIDKLDKIFESEF